MPKTPRPTPGQRYGNAADADLAAALEAAERERERNPTDGDVPRSNPPSAGVAARIFGWVHGMRFHDDRLELDATGEPSCFTGQPARWIATTWAGVGVQPWQPGVLRQNGPNCSVLHPQFTTATGRSERPEVWAADAYERGWLIDAP
jgi:hypothetical protein